MRFQNLLLGFLCVGILLLFFYKTILFGLIPFPGDLLIANYEPYKSLQAGVPHKGQGADVIRELYPWKYFSIESLKNGEFPLWNPYVFSGNPHFASLQSGTLYPVNIIFFLLPFASAWAVYIIFQYAFLLIFTYLFLRSISLSRLASIFGAISFSFCSFAVVWGWYGNIGHALSFLPLALLSVEKICQNKKWYWFVLLVLSLTSSILAGYAQISIYIYILVFLFAVARFLYLKSINLQQIIFIIAAMMLSIGISAVQLFPLYELVNFSARSTYGYNELLERLLPFESFITYLVPDFFGNPATHNYFLQGGSILERSMHVGLWVVIFAIYAVSKKRNFYSMFFGISAGFLLLTIISNPLVAYMHSIGLPILSTGIPTRSLSIVSFCIAVLGALGLDFYLKSTKEKRKLLLIVGVVIFSFIGLWIAAYTSKDPNFLISRRNLILPTGILILGSLFIVSRLSKRIVVLIIIFLTLFELFYSFQKFNSFVPYSYIYPSSEIMGKIRTIQGADRTWGYGSGYIDSDLQIMEKVHSTDGYNPLFSKRYGEFLSAQNGGVIQDEIPRTVAFIKTGYGVNDLKNDFYRRRAMDLTSIKYVLNKSSDIHTDSAFDEHDFTLLMSEGGWQVYKNLGTIPRVGLFDRYEVISNSKDAIKRLYSPRFDYSKTVILEKQLGNFTVSTASAKNVNILTSKSNSMTLNTVSNANQLLLITDNYFPGWKAKVDGVSAPVLRANYTFMAVPISPGKHTVNLYYFPDSFKYGIVVSSVSVICLLSLVLFGTLLKPYAQKNKKK